MYERRGRVESVIRTGRSKYASKVTYGIMHAELTKVLLECT